MAGFKPNTTIYLCSGTGMDMGNSIWWHRFAYPLGEHHEQDSWWNTCFQWFKAHSIAEGFWYCTTVDTSRGYFTVGRTPQNNGSIEQGQNGLGSRSKQNQLDDPSIPFIEAIRAVDYVVFANDGQNGYLADIQYAFVTNITSVNYSTATIHFEIDALMTYQKFFHLGQSFVVRDMQFQERLSDYNGKPNYKNLNLEPEPFEPSEQDYVFRKCTDLQARDPNVTKLLNFGKYDRCFVLTDIDLQADKIKPNPYYGGLPSLEPSEFTMNNGTNLGIGIYCLPKRKNNAFNTLGSYNAMEHILYTWLVPHNLVKQDRVTGTEPLFVAFADDWADNATQVLLKFPNGFEDKETISSGGEYTPMNMKCYNAPYRYFSIVDKQGGSIEIIPQTLYNLEDGSDDNNYFIAYASFIPQLAPNTASTLVIGNTYQMRGSPTDPFLTLWQMPSYSMTPNNSGYNQNMVNAMYQKNMAKEMIVLGGSITIASNLLNMAGGLIGMGLVGGATGGIGMMQGNSIGTNVASSITQPIEQVGTGLVGGGVTALNAGINNIYQADAQKVYGLPKAVGGLPQGFTYFNMDYPGYEFYVIHWKKELIKKLDMIFSIYGYMQNKFRYPHINIRRRWCYVKLQDVNIVPQSANEYIMGGIPMALRQQIETRLKNGVTFWNLRQGIMGNRDSGGSGNITWNDPRIQNTINCNFVKNYGGYYNSANLYENMSFTNGYASDYTDDFDDRR